MACHLLLVGMMGAGKTSLGKLLARRLSMPWVDTDEEVVRESGTSVADLFLSQGEEQFRARESQELRRVLTGRSAQVVSVGGGAVLDPSNRILLRDSGVVVWLRAEPATLARRVGDGTGRPLLNGDAAESLRRISAQRRELYEEVCHTAVDTDGRSLEELAELVERTYRDQRERHPEQELESR